jgi:Gram-negative bacterial TonB protein C-terminal
MFSRFLGLLIVIAGSISLLSWGQNTGSLNLPKNGGGFSNDAQSLTKVPEGVILVTGAWSSASDSTTPLPEGGSVTDNVFRDEYFGMTYALPSGWTEEYEGPPPSDSGRYVLAQMSPAGTYKEPLQGSVLITAQDMFFVRVPAANALELIDYAKDHLQADYKIDLPSAEIKIAGHSFRFFGYESPAAQLHWYVVATEIRCHTVEIVLTSRETKLLGSLLRDMNKMTLPAETSPTVGAGGGDFPVCIKDYARDENVISRVDPVFTEHTFNSVPVRIVIDKEGKVKHVHFLSAFPDQAKAITDAMKQWKFRPYLRDGHPVEVETGIMFGRAAYPATFPARGSATE